MEVVWPFDHYPRMASQESSDVQGIVEVECFVDVLRDVAKQGSEARPGRDFSGLARKSSELGPAFAEFRRGLKRAVSCWLQENVVTGCQQHRHLLQHRQQDIVDGQDVGSTTTQPQSGEQTARRGATSEHLRW